MKQNLLVSVVMVEWIVSSGRWMKLGVLQPRELSSVFISRRKLIGKGLPFLGKQERWLLILGRLCSLGEPGIAKTRGLAGPVNIWVHGVVGRCVFGVILALGVPQTRIVSVVGVVVRHGLGRC